jgi:DNA-binding transcriptional LysR family regulator
MDMRHLKTLVTVSEADSFARAAEQLFITPAAVSQQIRLIEQQLGIQLFDRSIRPPGLNPDCEDLVKRARDIVQQFEEFRDSARSQEVHGRLSIGSVNGIMVSLLPETLRSLARRYPRVRLRIAEGSSRVLTQRVKRRELDAAIVTDPTNLPDTLEMLPIFSEPLIVIGNPDSTASNWREMLANESFIKLNPGTGVGALVEKSLRRFRIQIREMMELDSSDSVVQMALAGLGCGVVPSGRVSAENARLLKIYPFGDPQVHRQVAIIRRRNARSSQLSELLSQELQAQAALRPL